MFLLKNIGPLTCLVHWTRK